MYVIAATNRPDMIDPAMCRPGRLDKLLYVDLPSADERAEIVRKMTRRVPLGDGVQHALDALARERCDSSDDRAVALLFGSSPAAAAAAAGGEVVGVLPSVDVVDTVRDPGLPLLRRGGAGGPGRRGV